MEFDKSENLKQMIEKEQEKLERPYGFTGEFNIEALRENQDAISAQIQKIARDYDYRTSLFLICEMARNWIESHPGETVYKAKIPLNPRTKKNSQRIVKNKKTGKQMILPDTKYKEYEKEAGWFIRNPKQKPIDYPVNVKCLFYRENEIRCDLTNLLEAIDDILVKYGVLADDKFKIIAGHDGSRVFIDRDNPRTEIEITRMPNYNPNNGGGKNGQPTD